MARKLLPGVIKLAFSVGLIAWLVLDARQGGAFDRLAHEPKHWPSLALGASCCLAAVLVSFVRWMGLVRALDIPFSLGDALRLGFLGYMLNFVSLGSVGGDLFKAVFVAREKPGRRAQAVTTVIVDRAVGLYALVMVACGGVLATGLWSSSNPAIHNVALGTLVAAGVMTVAGGLVCLPWVAQVIRGLPVSRIPKAQGILGKLADAIDMYRRRPGTILAAFALSVIVHALTTTGVYLAAGGLPGSRPDLAKHFVAVPLALVTGVLPLPAGGLGAFEGALDLLYWHLGGVSVSKGQGLLVALAYRLITVLIAIVGAGYYAACRREVGSVLANIEPFETDSRAAAPTVAR